MNKSTIENSYPLDYSKKYLLGAIQINASVFDTGNTDESRRFKHMINLKFFWYKFSCVIRSSSTGTYIINEKEVL